MRLIQYQAKLKKEKSGGYSVSFPDVAGCFTQGESKEEALENAVEALSLHLEEARNPKWHVPKPREHKGKNLHWIEPNLEIAVPLTVRLMREESQLTQTEIAKRLSMKVQQYQKLEYPGKSNPTLKIFLALSQATGYVLEVKKKKAS